MMNAKKLGALAVVTAVVIVAAVFIEESRKPVERTALPQQVFFPDLMSRLGDVAGIGIVSKDNRVTLSEKAGRWEIGEMHGYPADPDKVRRLITGMAGLAPVEKKTSNPELYPRLGVEDLSSPDAGSVEVSLSNRGGALLARLIVGDSRPPRGDASAMELYVRRPGEAQSWLARGDLRVARTPDAWLDRRILDIQARRIRQVDITQKDGSRLRIFKEKPQDKAYQLAGLPVNAEVKASHRLDAIAGALADLTLTNVAPAKGESPAGEQSLHAVFDGFDGLQVSMTVTDQEEGGPVAAFAVKATDEADEAVKKEAAELDARLKPWLFAIPAYRLEPLRTAPDDLVEKPQPKAAG